MATRRVRTTRVEVSSDRGVFMISVAAELAEMHPQTLRMYESRGLIEPKRSPKGTRLYSQEDVDRLRRIQEMTAELGMNLAGVERVFELEEQLESMARKLAGSSGAPASWAPRCSGWRPAPRTASRNRALRARRCARAPCRPAAARSPAGPAARGSASASDRRVAAHRYATIRAGSEERRDVE